MEISAARPTPFNKLPKRHREFIENYVKTGELGQSYRACGYKCPDNQLNNKARALAKKLAPYLDEQLDKYIKGTEMGIFGLSRLRDLAENAESEQVRFNAARELLNKNLPEGPKVVEHHHVERMGTQELKAEIQRMLGNQAIPIEGEVVKKDE